MDLSWIVSLPAGMSVEPAERDQEEEGVSYGGDDDLPADGPLTVDDLLRSWNPGTKRGQDSADAYRNDLGLERQFVAAGGLLIAGPDPTGNGGVIPGFGDQREIELLVEAGFSPVEANRIGRPVTEATDSAAPPRASPSSLDSTTPVKPTPSANACAVATASWPIIASMTNRT